MKTSYSFIFKSLDLSWKCTFLFYCSHCKSQNQFSKTLPNNFICAFWHMLERLNLERSDLSGFSVSSILFFYFYYY